MATRKQQPPDPDPQAPPKSAAKEDWVDHAAATGVPREEAAAATKAELIDATADKAPRGEPHYYIADTALFVGDPAESGTVPVRAFNRGDHVLPADVARFGWRPLVHRPDDTEE